MKKIINLVLWIILASMLLSSCAASLLEITPQEPLGNDYLNLTSRLPENASAYLIGEHEFKSRFQDDVSAWLTRGSLQIKTANYTDASLSFSRATILDPGNRTAYIGLLQSHLNSGNFDYLFSNATKMSRTFPGDTSARLYQGYALLNQDKVKEANSIYDDLISTGSDQVAARYYKAEAEYDLHEYQKSLDLYNDTLSMDPGFAAAWEGIGFVQAYGMKNRNASMEAYDKAIALDNRYIGAYFSKAAALSDVFNSSNESLLVYNKAVELDPKNPDVLCAKATALITMNYSVPGQYPMDEVIALSENATRLAPGYWGGWNNYACALLILNRNEEAVDICKKTVELAPEECIPLINLGIVYYRLGMYEELNTVINQMGDCSSLSQDASTLVYKGFFLEALKRNDEALATYDMAIRLSPSSIQAWQSKGDLLQRMGRYLDARSAYAKANEISLQYNV